MDPLTLLKVGGALLSGLGGLKKQPTGLDLQKLREDALAAGFNPLTVLRLTGAAGYERLAQPSPLTAIGNTLTAVGDVFDLKEAQQMARDQHQLQMSMASREQQVLSLASARSFSVDVGEEHFPLFTSRFAGMAVEDIPYWSMMAPDGSYFGLRANVAERLGLAEGAHLLAEDYEAIMGDFASEIVSITDFVAQGVDDAMGGGPSQIFQKTSDTPQPQPQSVDPFTLPMTVDVHVLGLPQINDPFADFFKQGGYGSDRGY